ncbi:outer membrane protein assembly factor BamD [Zhouia sp. PK063]|uniref:outer membrane protein assembly factor BamD n=1 Tax=Zhouia sp. PK063 TaxID=3373602 RepID=UPI0037988587
MIIKRRFSNFLLGSILLMGVVSCGEYQNALKGTDVKVKYTLAEKLYNDGEYKKALRLFDQIAPQYVNKPQGERVLYFYANSYYQIKDYTNAGYQFERFAKSYPRSDKAEEAYFLSAKCSYMLSPRYSIDQTDTYTAINKLQEFIDRYPDSELMTEANQYMQELKNKLEKKSYEIAKQYDKIRDYQASIKSFDMFLSDNPGSVYTEDALYYKLDAAYKLATNSIMRKKEGRLDNAKTSYNDLVEKFPESKYKEAADKMNASIDDQLKEFSK